MISIKIKQNNLFCKKVTNVIGKFKIETPVTKNIDEFCALRSEAYAYIKPDTVGEEKRVKGMNTTIMETKKLDKNKMYSLGPFEVWKRENESLDDYGFGNKSYQMYLPSVNKLALNAFDGKRKCLKSIKKQPW